ncbi:retrovirus-related pol polyprotein from transposon TNT 1-94 [Tanacetum coccineum]
MTYSEQTHIIDFLDNKINNDSNIIPYSQYLQEKQDSDIQNTNSFASNDLLVLYLVEQMTDQVANFDKENQTNKMVNESLTAELERYKERVAIFEQRINADSNNRENLRIKPTLYDGSVIAKEHVVISVIDDEETLIFEEESRSKMLDKQNDPISIEKKIKISPIDYSKLNIIKEDFVEAPRELPKVSLVNESLKKLRYQLASFEKVVKKRTTSDAITAGFYYCGIKNELRKLKGKNVMDTAVSKSSVVIIALGMLKINLVPLAPKLLKNKDAHIDYINHTKENADILWELVKNAKALSPLDSNLDSALPPKETTITPSGTPTQGILVYSWRPKAQKLVGSSSKSKMVFQIILWNDYIAKIMGYGDYQMRNVTISRVYYVEGLEHNLFSMGQFCDSDLEVAFRKNACFIRDLEGVDLLKGSRGSNLYTLSLENLMISSPICLLSKASKTKSWLWHRILSYLNFDYINTLAKQGLVRGLPKLKYQKDHLCSACALGKSKKHSYKPKAEDSI